MFGSGETAQPVDSWAGLSGSLILGYNIFIWLVKGLGEMQGNHDISHRNEFYIFRCSGYTLDASVLKM